MQRRNQPINSIILFCSVHFSFYFACQLWSLRTGCCKDEYFIINVLEAEKCYRLYWVFGYCCKFVSLKKIKFQPLLTLVSWNSADAAVLVDWFCDNPMWKWTFLLNHLFLVKCQLVKSSILTHLKTLTEANFFIK